MKESLIYQSPNSKVFYIEESEWKKPVALKILNYEFPSPSDIAQFNVENELLQGLQIKGVRNVLKPTKIKNRHALYLEWFDGKTVAEVFKNKAGDILDFLHIAISISEAIFNIHGHQIIHKDISGGNILVNLAKRQVNVIDFGIASKFALRQQHLGNPSNLEGTLLYNSPEQTGRMNRIVDYRTDLYSMGVLFYQMITGQLPFQSTDPLELVHAHIAQIPTPVHEVLPKIPEQISLIINKLLSKNAENRYQSAKGVQLDLENCLKQFEATGKIESFPIAKQDFSGKFQIPQKLYGREKEIGLIDMAFKSSAGGASEILMIAGYSGTGKSALVHELHKPITAERGFFVEGKFDQYQRAVPYFAIIKALEELMNILLIEPEAQLEKIKNEILEAIGGEGKVLTNVLPKLAYIIGEQPEIPELGGTEAQNRFFYVMRKFVQQLATKAHPIVLFIDDLQWADSASLSLLKSLMTDPESGYLLCIGAYRNNEVGAAHPLLKTIEEIEEASNNQVSTIEIGNLSLENVRQLVNESLENESEESEVLTNLVYEKTGGNAFFVNQFMQSLYEEELLVFNFETYSWNWDIQKIRAKNISDNIVELLAGKIQRLPENTGRALRSAACVGNSFDLEVLSRILNLPSEQVKKDLTEALKEGLITFGGQENYKFSHDRIQQAVYSLIPEEEKNTAHWNIGRLLNEKSSKEEREAHIFDIVNQLNFGLGFIKTSEKEGLSKLNLQAGKKATLNAAFQLSLEYFQTGIQLLSNDSWKSQRDLCMDLHSEATEAAYLSGDFDKMERFYETILKHSKNVLDNIKPHSIRILAYKAENKLLESIDVGLGVLEQLGEKFPKKPGMHHVLADYAKTIYALRGKNEVDFLALPMMEDPEKKAAVQMMTDLMSSAYWATPTLSPLLTFRMLRLSLEYGSHTVSPFAYACYGVLECGIFGNMRKGQKFANISLALLDKLGNKEWIPQVYVSAYSLITHWNEHAQAAFKPLQDSYHIGLETGAIEFACVNTNLYCINAYLVGRQLEKLEAETKAYSDSYTQLKQGTNLIYNEVFRQAMLNLMGKSENPTMLIGEAYDEVKMLTQATERDDRTGKFFIHFNKLILGYLFQDYEMAKTQANETRVLLDAVLAKFEIPNQHFYEALTFLALAPTSATSERRKMLNQVKKNIKKLKNWAKYAPQNYEHKHQLLEAEVHRLKGNFDKAGTLYDAAIEGAIDNGYLNEQAIAYELAGRFYLEKKSENLARYYLKSAFNSYRQWGAFAKAEMLSEQYPAHISNAGNSSGSSASSFSVSITNPSSTGGLQSETLDIATVFKASTAISGEVVLSRLLALLMKIILENAGAQRGCLLLKNENNDELLIQAHHDVSGNVSEVLQNIPPGGSGLLSAVIVKYVQRTQESIVLNDAVHDSRFQNDDYILKQKPQSIICLPIVNQGKFIGIIYLENNATTNAFTKDRIDLLTLLSGQIAVSIDNAILYEQMDQKVKDRTFELAAEKEKSDNLLYNILPRETAEELKIHGKTKPRKFESVTVLFTDFVGFTRISMTMSPEQLVDIIGTCFSAFDAIVQKYNIEKIKTIGDAYMCAGGLPIPNSTNASDAVKAAIDMRNWITGFNKEQIAKNLPVFDIRIGLHTGPIVAGVVGTNKFAYDIWGDTVNTASRLESNSEAGKVNISGDTYELVKGKFDCVYRGKIKAKNRGEIDMYFIENL